MIILQKIIENKRTSLNIPSEWLYRDLDKFGLKWKLFSYQKEALENIISVLYLIYRDTDRFSDNDLKKNKTELFRLYQECGLSGELVEELAITKQNENFEFLSKYFTTDTEIPFQNFINRAAFWMATGCGKTLVMIKLLVILSDLMYKKLIPKKDILILAPKDEILSQIKDHINKFNKGAEIKINLRNLKEWERIKNQQDMFSKSEMNVFYYRADNIGDKGTVSKKKDGQRIDYESIYNNGNWYLILDEAHKGEKETSKRQQYFMVLTQNGFLFNFSATFTDELDKITTVFDYKLDIFLREGYGKKLYISDSDFKSFSVKQTDDFSEEEKKSIIAQTLIIFALAKKHFIKLNIINNNLYHSPLLITLANSVNTEEADLKLFYMLLSEIARGRFDFERTKRNLVEKLENQESYLFGLGEIDDSLIGEIRTLGKEDFFKNVFHTEKKGNIEVAKFRDNDRELAFKHVCADKYFMLIVASDIIKWEDNVLEGYQWGRVIEESFFEDINKRNSINILLGSRIFSEGWDTNRPNIINFINIGVSDDAQKFVLQSIGRGIN